MARTKQKSRRNRNREQGDQQNKESQDGKGWKTGNYKSTEKKNEDFEKYYKAQGLVPEGEWDAFMETLRTPLPATFRITGFKRQSEQLLSMIKSEYFGKLVNLEVEGRQIKPPKPLPWYPSGLAWQLDFDRKFIRQSEAMKNLHTFLIEETESGNISRQEAVSMIPPLVLDVKPHHKVLDMCAAPGSKTAQLLEMLHADDTKPVPEGCVVANDSDNKRCYLMTHQVKRLETPSFMIVNQDASCMPNFKIPDKEGNPVSMRFDRILADVPCSGDGTLRKNVDAWGKWHAHTGMHLHNIQTRILSRGLEMLEVGGRLVYSTCSLNPTEDEAVVSCLLRKSKGTVRLVDVSSVLPGLKSVPGVSTWKVMSRELEEFASREDLPPRLLSTIRPSVFPPTDEEAKEFQLHKCMRVLPHAQDTGGFFISVLEKTDELPWIIFKKKPAYEKEVENSEENPKGEETAAKQSAPEEGSTAEEAENKDESSTTENKEASVDKDAAAAENNAESSSTDLEVKGGRKRPWENDRPGSPKQRKRRQFGYKEDPFIFIDEEDPIWPPIKDFFGLQDFPVGQLLVRCAEGKKRNVYFTSAIIKTLVKHNEQRIKIINLGLKMLSRSESQHVTCPFRTVQDGLMVLFPHVTRRVVTMTRDDIVTLLSSEMPFLSRFTDSARHQLEVLAQGSVVFVYDPQPDDKPEGPKCRLILCGWLGKTSCRSFIPLSDRGHYLRMCGAELKSKEQRKKEALNASIPKSERDPGLDEDNFDTETTGNTLTETVTTVTDADTATTEQEASVKSETISGPSVVEFK